MAGAKAIRAGATSMKWKSRAKSLLLVLILCAAFSSTHVYSDYDSIREADFLGHGLKFEAADLDFLVADKPKIHDFTPSIVVLFRPSYSDLFQKFEDSFLYPSTSFEMTSPLRC